jgi:tRNA dimethylallyltransferase
MALAARLPLEIVVMDSAQVYRGMDIGTAKASAEERARVPHHLIDVVDPDQPYSAGRWRSEAITRVKEILAREKMPLIVGGTMLYYRALAQGLDELPQADEKVRAAIDAEAAGRGWPALHGELARVDPQAASRIMPNDAQRIQRALEVWRITGKPLSSQQRNASPQLPFAIAAFAVTIERAELHRRIEQRFDDMLRDGLVDELRRLRERFSLRPDMPSMRAVGYRQVWCLLEGRVDAATMRARAIAATRQLAKRQITWLRSFPDLARLDGAGAEDAARRLFHSFL